MVSISVAEDENCPPTIGRASLELPALPKSPSIIITKPDNSTCRPKTDSVSSTAPTASGKKNSSWRRRIGHRKSKSLSENISLPLDQVNDSGIQPQSDDVSDTETLVGDEGLDNQLVCAPVVRQPSPCASIFPPFYPTEKQLPAPPSPSATVDDSPRPDSNSSASSGVFQRTIQFRLPEESHRRLSNKVKNRNLLTIEISSHDPSRRTSPRKYVKTPLPRSPLSPARRAITSRTLRAQTLIPASQLRALEKHLEAELPLTPATSSGDSDCLRELIDRLGHYSGSSHHQSDSESIAESTISDRLFEDRLLNCIRPLPPKYRRQPSASGLSPIQASPRSPHRSSAQHPRQTQGRNRTQPARAPRRVGSWPSLKSPGFHSKSRSSSRSTITDQAGTPSDVESTFEERLKDVYRSALRPGRLSTKSSLDTFTPVSPVPPFKLTKTLLQRQNLFPPEQVRLLHTLLQREHPHSPIVSSPLRSAPHSLFSTISPRTAAFGAAKGMGHRKVWVKRAGGSATTIVVRDSDLVDDVRDMVLTKYGNSLGRTFDAPDINIRVVPRAGAANRPNGVERLLGPDEAINEILDTYFKDGQSMEEALVIELPPRKTPKASPRNTPGAFYPEEHPMHLTHPHHREYFPPTGLLVHNAADAIVSSNVPLNSPGRYRRPKPSRRQTQSPVSAHSSKQVDEKNGMKFH